MSYILDALKKSEVERSGKAHPEFEHRVPFAETPRRQREFWPYLLGLALAANIVLVVYATWPAPGPGDEAVVSGGSAPVQRQQPSERATRDSIPEPSVQEKTQAAGSVANAESDQPMRARETDWDSAPVVAEESLTGRGAGASRSDTPDAPAQEQKTVPQEPLTESTEKVPDIHAMPRSVQRRVPDMTFNAHLHSSDPSSRSVMINNRMLREGDRLGELLIDEITAAGVVFRLDGHAFRMDVVRGWQGTL